MRGHGQGGREDADAALLGGPVPMLIQLKLTALHDPLGTLLDQAVRADLNLRHALAMPCAADVEREDERRIHMGLSIASARQAPRRIGQRASARLTTQAGLCKPRGQFSMSPKVRSWWLLAGVVQGHRLGLETELPLSPSRPAQARCAVHLLARETMAFVPCRCLA